MKWLGLVLVFLPVALSTPVQERVLLLDVHTLTTLFNTTILKQDLQNLVDIIGSDASEQLCEHSCVPMMQKADHTHLLQHACPLVCNSLQMLIQKLHLTHPAQNPVQTLKRSLLDALTSGLKTDQLTELLQQLVDMLGSDPTIQMIENECHVIMKDPVLDSGCHFIARGFQSLLQSLHIHPKPNTPGAVINTRRTRSIIDTIGVRYVANVMVVSDYKLIALSGMATRYRNDIDRHFDLALTLAMLAVPITVLPLDNLHTLGLNLTALKIEAQQMLDAVGPGATLQDIDDYCLRALTAFCRLPYPQRLHLMPDPGTPGSGAPVG